MAAKLLRKENVDPAESQLSHIQTSVPQGTLNNSPKQNMELQSVKQQSLVKVIHDQVPFIITVPTAIHKLKYVFNENVII